MPQMDIKWHEYSASMTTENEPCYVSPVVCLECGAENKLLLPVEPLFDREMVCLLIPCTLHQLNHLLNKKLKHLPRRYRVINKHGDKRPYRLRMWTSSEVRLIRNMLIEVRNDIGV